MIEIGRDDSEQYPLSGATSLEVSLTVNNLATSVDWYRNVLGFVIDKEHEREMRVIAVSLRSGKVRILLGQDDGSKGINRQKGEGFSFQITTSENVDALATRARNAGAILDTEPVEIFPGKRVFRLRDPDGFRIVVSSDPASG
jgi:uncharacterized glyoxalase superfamily protein PhnB